MKHFSALSSAFVHLPSMQRCASFGAASAGSHWCSQRWPDYARNDHKSSRLCLCVLERAVTSKPRGFVVTLWPESWTVCAEQAPESRPPSLSLSVVIICISTSRQRTDAIFSHNVKERQKKKQNKMKSSHSGAKNNCPHRVTVSLNKGCYLKLYIKNILVQ